MRSDRRAHRRAKLTLVLAVLDERLPDASIYFGIRFDEADSRRDDSSVRVKLHRDVEGEAQDELRWALPCSTDECGGQSGGWVERVVGVLEYADENFGWDARRDAACGSCRWRERCGAARAV